MQDALTRRRALLYAAVLAAAGAAVYLNGLGAPFLFDDEPNIIENPAVRGLWPLSRFAGNTRPFGTFTFALNYAAGGLDPRGYRAVNIAIHVAAGLLLWAILRRTFRSAPLRDQFGGAADGLAFAAALLWLVHPLHTGAVTYVVQRYESLMGMFYLWTLYAVIRGGESPRRGWWHAAAVGGCALGAATKEVIVTAPIVIWLYEVVFHDNRPDAADGEGAADTGGVPGPAHEGGCAPCRSSGRWTAPLRRSPWLYAGLLACAVGLAVFRAGGADEAMRAPARGMPTSWEYLRTQPAVLLRYARLSLWPAGQCLDYEWPVARKGLDILPSALAVACLLAAAVLGLRRRAPAAFVGVWFFGILSVTSSFLPILDLCFEHRMYLPLAGLTAWGCALVWRFLRAAEGRRPWAGRRGLSAGRIAAALLAAAAAALGTATVVRNRVYLSDVAAWTDVARKRPDNLRARVNLGWALFRQGRIEETESLARYVLDRGPDGYAYGNLGMVRRAQGRNREAEALYRQALRLEPALADAHYNLGNLLADEGRLEEAVEAFAAAIRHRPMWARPRNNLGIVYARQGRVDEAIREFEEALRLDPRHDGARRNLEKARGMLADKTENRTR